MNSSLLRAPFSKPLLWACEHKQTLTFETPSIVGQSATVLWLYPYVYSCVHFTHSSYVQLHTLGCEGRTRLCTLTMGWNEMCREETFGCSRILQRFFLFRKIGAGGISVKGYCFATTDPPVFLGLLAPRQAEHRALQVLQRAHQQTRCPSNMLSCRMSSGAKASMPVAYPNHHDHPQRGPCQGLGLLLGSRCTAALVDRADEIA